MHCEQYGSGSGVRRELFMVLAEEHESGLMFFVRMEEFVTWNVTIVTSERKAPSCVAGKKVTARTFVQKKDTQCATRVELAYR